MLVSSPPCSNHLVYVPVEMMMHELPIIATATSGLNEVVDESCALKIPLIVSSDSVEIDVSLLAEKILYLLQNPEEAKRLGKTAASDTWKNIPLRYLGGTC